ncbi:MAG: amino acid ABC transporter substrate-binding protein [Betaproteobacteria bacterium]|jgi:branched-chain amino acid transport system substrate-binding protein|nr:amino acid ABC transporter substrate-binding protein [Betaproteobacteria bacterium]
MKRSKSFMGIAVALTAAALLAPVAPAAAQNVRIGYAIARTGPWAPGAQVTQEPNYIMWAEQVNAAGGLNVGGKKRKIELIGYDDRSNMETVVRSYEKLMSSDKVDLILPPWGTGANFAIMSLAKKYHYPMLSCTATGRKLVDAKNPYFFALLQQPDVMMDALAEYMVARKVKTAAVIHVDELFGLEQFTSLKSSMAKKGIKILEAKSYPLGIKDLSPVLKDMQAKKPDAFIGLTYPPGTFLSTGQAKAIGFNAKIFYLAVGTAFPIYRDKMGAATVEGVMGLGTWNPKTGAAAKAYFDAHVKRWKKEPDRWASAFCYAGLEILQDAVEKVGLDRKKIRDYIANTTHQTIIGPMRFKGSENVSTPGVVSQWQSGEFEVVWPPQRATSAALFPKPDWK